MCVLGSPFSVPVRELVDPSKVRCFGPGLGAGVRAHVPQTFTVDSSKAGLAPLLVQLCGPTGKADMRLASLRRRTLTLTHQRELCIMGI